MFYKMPFGYSCLNVDNKMSVFTGKIRIKTSEKELTSLLNHPEVSLTQETRDCWIINFATTNAIVNGKIISDI